MAVTPETGPDDVATYGRTRHRVEPSTPVAVVLVLAYMAVVNGMQVTTGIDYQDWFANADNAVRTAVIPLSVASVLLLLFLRWARWDMVWRDPERLPVPALAMAVIGLLALTVLVRLASIHWGDVPGDLLAAILATGVLVGLAEELLFRGIVLRSLRTNRRPESWAALWTALGFGLFHLPNVFMGTGPAGLTQVGLAALSGYGLYLVRRWRGLLWMGMVAHGIWDISAFLTGDYASDLGQALALALNLVMALACVVAYVRSIRHDRTITVTPNGVVPVGDLR